MYRLSVQLDFSAAHHLRDYPGKCSRLHGHNYRVEVTVAATELDESGMVIDFSQLKDLCAEITAELDHTLLNDHPFFQQQNPTSENIARYIYGEIAQRLIENPATVTAVHVWESATSSATYMEG